MKDKILFTVCFGFIFGVLLASFVSINIYTNIHIAFMAMSLFMVLFVILKSKWGIIFSIFLLTISLGIFRFNFEDRKDLNYFYSLVSQEVSLEGVLVDEPTIGDKTQRLNVKIEKEGEETKVLLMVKFGEEFHYGDRIAFTGVLERPENFTTEEGKDFDYINYLKKDGIYFIVLYPQIEVLNKGEGNFIKKGLFAVKNKFLENINISIPNPESLLMGGLILGEKTSFDDTLRQEFIDTGTIHIVALSGYNITIVAEWFMKIFSFLSVNYALGAGIFSIMLFVIMTGGSATGVRAGIMAVLALLSRLVGRNYAIGRALVVTAFLMIFLNPFILVFDVSFQLSFIATIAVIYLSPKMEKYFKWVTSRFKLRDIITVTFSAYIFVLPFILYKMGNLSIVALPANILVLPFIPITMLFGFLTGFVGIIWSTLATPFGLVSYLLLHYELGVIHLLASLPFASLQIENFPLWLTILIYAYFIYRLFRQEITLFFKGI